MCIGLPMQVLSTTPGHATVAGRGVQRHIDTALVGEVQPGDWLLIFLDAARERISAERAAEVNATLDLMAGLMAGAETDPAQACFELPSAMSAGQLAMLTGEPAAPHP